MEGVIFNLQRFSIHDGPGIRTTVFLKGCPLRCPWCHNPEGLSVRPQISFNPEKCIGCGECAICPRHCHSFGEMHRFDRSACIACGKCADSCPAGALEKTGETVTVEEVTEKILRDIPFYNQSGGGVTLSGGEPLAQPAFVLELAKAIKAAGLHLCIETSGGGSQETLLALAQVTDLFLFDYKCDFSLYREIVGYDGNRIEENLLALDAAGAETRLRCPVIPGVNDNAAHFSSLAKLANRLTHCQGIDLEAYHSLGLSKRKRYGMQADYTREELLDREALEPFLAQLRRETALEAVIQ